MFFFFKTQSPILHTTPILPSKLFSYHFYSQNKNCFNFHPHFSLIPHLKPNFSSFRIPHFPLCNLLCITPPLLWALTPLILTSNFFFLLFFCFIFISYYFCNAWSLLLYKFLFYLNSCNICLKNICWKLSF